MARNADALRRIFRGEVLAPSDPGYDGARRVWNAMVDKSPAIIARCSGVEDVVVAVRFGRDTQMEVSVRSGGHSVAGYSVTDGGLMIDMSAMKGVRVEADQRRAWVNGGSLLADLDRATREYGLGTPTGAVSHTGIAGLTLGGGEGWTGRKFGLTCDNLVAAEVVTAAGERVRATADENADLLWGLRGGGGNFGIVTGFEFQLHPIAPEVAIGDFVYDAREARPVLQAFRECAAAASNDVMWVAWTGAARGWPFLDEKWHGRPVLFASYISLDPDVRAIAEPLRKAGKPLFESEYNMEYLALQSQSDEPQQHDQRRYWKSHLLAGLSDDALDAFLDTALSVAEESPACGAELLQWGGAIASVGENETAFTHRDAAFDFIATASWKDVSEDERHIAAARRLGAAMAPFAVGVYSNNLGDEGDERTRAAYGVQKYERLVALKDRYDPGNMFRLNQNVRPSKL